jgi:hypothetical protein
MNKYPAKTMMDQMATQGRYGDSMLVHMNPVEVAGLASLSPTGQLTTNPVTGQPEAFLPFLAPLLGIAGGAMGLSTLGTAALTGIGTAAITGDLKRGLISGLTAGVAGGIGDMVAGGAEAATAGVEAATSAADVATQQALDGVSGTLESGIDRALAGAVDGGVSAGTDIAGQLAQTQGNLAALAPEAGDIAGQLAQSQGSMNAAIGGAPESASGFAGFSDRVDDVVNNMSGMQRTLAIGTGSGQLAQMDAMDAQAEQAAELERESHEKRMQAYNDLQAAYGAAQPGIATGMSPMRAGISNLIPDPYIPTMGASGGGYIKRMAEGGETSPLVVEPTQEEARVLASASGRKALSAEDQNILQGYYNRRNEQMAANQQAEADAAAAESGIVDGVFRIPDGATNREALNYLLQAGMIRQEDFNWFQEHFGQSGSGDSQYLASESFPGIDKYLEQNNFNDENKAKVRRVLGALDQAQTTGIKEDQLNYLTEGALTSFNPYGGRGGNAGYGGIDPISVQAGLRGAHSVAPPPDYMTGFEPEFSYFQDDPNNIRVPTRMYRPTQQGIESEGGYFDPILDKEEYLAQLKDYYRRLANYTPAEVEYPEETPSETDDPDNQGPDDNEGGEGDPGYPPTEGPENPEPPYVGPGGNTSSQWQTNKANILKKVQNGTATASEQQWYDDWVRAGKPETQKEMNDWRENNPFVVPSSPSAPAPQEDEAAPQEGLTLGGESAVSASGPGKGASKPTIPSPGSAAYYRMQKENPELLAQLEADRNAARAASKASTPQADPNAGPKPEGVSDYVWARVSSGDLTGLNPTSVTRNESQRQALVDAGYGDFVDQAAQKGYEQRVAHYMSNGATREEAEKTAAQGMAEGGPTADKVMLRTPMGEQPVEAGGIANIPTGMSASMPSEEEFQMLAAALMGMTDQADAIINMFVEKYGSEMFSQIRDMILKQGVPGAQTEGMIQGAGGGMDDMVGGMIGSQQPVAVSPGEYIVPADVVSGLGDGSSDAGARELDGMMDRVRMARGGTTNQAPPVNAQGVMPA